MSTLLGKTEPLPLHPGPPPLRSVLGTPRTLSSYQSLSVTPPLRTPQPPTLYSGPRIIRELFINGNLLSRTFLPRPVTVRSEQ